MNKVIALSGCENLNFPTRRRQGHHFFWCAIGDMEEERNVEARSNRGPRASEKSVNGKDHRRCGRRELKMGQIERRGERYWVSEKSSEWKGKGRVFKSLSLIK